jgi:hypothetical protein
MADYGSTEDEAEATTIHATGEKQIISHPHLGELQDISAEITNEIEDNEQGACFLQGTLFYDEELEWCMVSGWGLECGLSIVFYSPVASSRLAE